MNDQTKILFFDTETSNFIKKALSASDPEQAWTVQIGAILGTKEEELDKMNTIIQANGRSIGYHTQKIHGISAEQSDEEGVPELEAAEQFGLLLRQAELVVCHNYAFDWNFVYQLMERNIDDMSDEARSAFYLDLPSFCTMKDKKINTFCGLKNKAGRPKWPKLIELHKILFDEDFDGAHDAFADITATARCFFELVERKLIVLEV